MSSKLTPIQTAIKLAGGCIAVARAFGVTRIAVYKWIRKDSIPIGRVLAIEKMVGGRVTRYQLRPDIYGLDPDLVAQGQSGRSAA